MAGVRGELPLACAGALGAIVGLAQSLQGLVGGSGEAGDLLASARFGDLVFTLVRLTASSSRRMDVTARSDLPPLAAPSGPRSPRPCRTNGPSRSPSTWH
ncbi:hypothetical protein ABZ860_35100 [Microbispora sp. NPDC046973]|uniref:hypothetical protein n=1 Tax=Microbispora sp. NPDC046973 TaxID=3155022 RepID=UPI0033C39F9C